MILLCCGSIKPKCETSIKRTPRFVLIFKFAVFKNKSKQYLPYITFRNGTGMINKENYRANTYKKAIAYMFNSTAF